MQGRGRRKGCREKDDGDASPYQLVHRRSISLRANAASSPRGHLESRSLIP
jgi:hypothetical protein